MNLDPKLYSIRDVSFIGEFFYLFFQKFPQEPLSKVVRNVFDFDRYSEETFDTLVSVLHEHGIPIGTSSTNISLAKE